MGKSFRVTPEMQAQVVNAARLMERYAAFARQIGCNVEQDEIVATAKQVKLLKAWWDKETKT